MTAHPQLSVMADIHELFTTVTVCTKNAENTKMFYESKRPLDLNVQKPQSKPHL